MSLISQYFFVVKLKIPTGKNTYIHNYNNVNNQFQEQETRS